MTYPHLQKDSFVKKRDLFVYAPLATTNGIINLILKIMENISFPKGKERWLAGQQQLEEKEEEQLSPEVYQERLSQIKDSFVTLNNDIASLYGKAKTKELNDALISLHVAHENLIA
jgi:hypothetical protein